jgi:YVTN family beta-propeller protein
MKAIAALAASIILALAFANVFAQGTTSGYSLVRTIQVPGDEGWDLCAVDEGSGRLFLSHGSCVPVVDVKSGKVVGTIADTKGVHGIALAPDLGKGYITNGKDSTVTVIKLATLAVVGKVQVTGANPDALIYDPFSHNVFVFNGGSSNATVIDAKTDKVKATVPLPGRPELPAVNDKGLLYVNLEDKSMVAVIDTKKLTVTSTWPLAPGEEPTGLAIDKVNNRLFAACHNKLVVVMDAASGKVVGSLPIGERVDGAAFDAGKKRAYCSNGDGTLTVIQEQSKDSFTVVENVATRKGSRTLALDGSTHHVYLPAADFDAAPTPTADNPHPRPAVKHESFCVLDFALVN